MYQRESLYAIKTISFEKCLLGSTKSISGYLTHMVIFLVEIVKTNIRTLCDAIQTWNKNKLSQSSESHKLGTNPIHFFIKFQTLEIRTTALKTQYLKNKLTVDQKINYLFNLSNFINMLIVPHLQLKAANSHPCLNIDIDFDLIALFSVSKTPIKVGKIATSPKKMSVWLYHVSRYKVSVRHKYEQLKCKLCH